MPGERTILIVDDDRKIAKLVGLYLEREGYRVVCAYDGQAALEQVRQSSPDLIVLDLMLPGISGLEICRRLRQQSTVPIIMLTARTTEQDKLMGLDLGADDYVTKPFSPRELTARVRAVLRRTKAEDALARESEIALGSLVLRLTSHEVLVENEPVELTPTEFRLLRILVQSPGRAFSRAQLLDLAFDPAFEGYERNVDVHISNLRHKLGFAADRPIRTVHGVGYRFEVS